MNLVHKEVCVHRIASNSLKPPLKKVEEEEGRRSQRAKCGGESRDRHSISFLNLGFAEPINGLNNVVS